MLQDPGWKSQLLGKAKDFPELAAALQVSAAAVGHAVRYQGAHA